MTEKNNGNNKSEIKWAEDTEKEHPETTLDESVVSLYPYKTTLCQMTKDRRDREADKKITTSSKITAKDIINNKNIKTTKHSLIWAQI